MKRSPALLTAVMIAVVLGVPAAGRQSAAPDQRALRDQIEKRFEIVPLADGMVLRPRTRTEGLPLVEIADGTILINGAPVSGSELRERLGADADAVIRLSYLGAEERRAFLGQTAAADAPVEAAPGAPPVETVAPVPPLPPTPAETRDRTPRRRASGDRVRIFGNVAVSAEEAISGQAVAVLGSVRVDGEVGDQVVAVMGSVDLGPRAVVRGDVVSVGGRVRRAEGAEVHGSITEIALAGVSVPSNVPPWVGRRGGPWAEQFGSAVPRLVGTTFRFLLLVLLASVAFLVARPLVEASAQRVSDNPVQATLVGIAAQILLLPALILTIVVLAISIIGIPLLILVPFALLLLVLLALAGFSSTAYAIGLWVRRRFNLASSPPFVDVLLGVLVILLPILLARFVALAGWAVNPLVIVLVMIGVTIEFLAWSSGFGAVLTNGYTRWQARRASRYPAVPPPAMP
jgi:hypothetical protein